MMSGARRATSAGSAMMRSAPSGSRDSSGKQSSPPAMPISSETQRMPQISGSSHSSKYTRGRRASAAPRGAHRFESRLELGTSAARSSSQPIMPPSVRIMRRISATLRWLNRCTSSPARAKLRGDVGLQVGESEHQVGLQRQDAVDLARW